MFKFSKVDRGLGWLLALGGALHAFGALQTYDAKTPVLVWSLAGSFAAVLLAALNLMRVNRPGDRMLAFVCFVGCLAWITIVLAFGVSIGNMLDPRVLYHAIVAIGLALFSAQSAFQRL